MSSFQSFWDQVLRFWLPSSRWTQQFVLSRSTFTFDIPSSSSIYNLPRFNSTNYWAVYINAPLSNRGGQLSLNHPNADITLFVAVCCNISKFGKVSTTSFTCYYTIICMVVIVLSYLSYSWLFQARWFVPLSSSISNLFELDSTNCRAVYIDTPLLDQDGT